MSPGQRLPARRPGGRGEGRRHPGLGGLPAGAGRRGRPAMTGGTTTNRRNPASTCRAARPSARTACWPTPRRQPKSAEHSARRWTWSAALVDSGGLAVVVVEAADLDPHGPPRRAEGAAGTGRAARPPRGGRRARRRAGSGRRAHLRGHGAPSARPHRRADPRAGPGDVEGHGADPRARAAGGRDRPVGVHLCPRDAHVQRALRHRFGRRWRTSGRVWCGSRASGADPGHELPVRARRSSRRGGRPSRARTAPPPRAPGAWPGPRGEAARPARSLRPSRPTFPPTTDGSRGSRSTALEVASTSVNPAACARRAGDGRRRAPHRSPVPPPGRARATGRGRAPGVPGERRIVAVTYGHHSPGLVTRAIAQCGHRVRHVLQHLVGVSTSTSSSGRSSACTSPTRTSAFEMPCRSSSARVSAAASSVASTATTSRTRRARSAVMVPGPEPTSRSRSLDRSRGSRYAALFAAVRARCDLSTLSAWPWV